MSESCPWARETQVLANLQGIQRCFGDTHLHAQIFHTYVSGSHICHVQLSADVVVLAYAVVLSSFFVVVFLVFVIALCLYRLSLKIKTGEKFSKPRVVQYQTTVAPSAPRLI